MDRVCRSAGVSRRRFIQENWQRNLRKIAGVVEIRGRRCRSSHGYLVMMMIVSQHLISRVFAKALISVKLHLNGQTDCPFVRFSTDKQTYTWDVNPVFTRLQVALIPHRMTPFLLRPNKSAQLLIIIVALMPN